jgi:predicted phosphodiesterase|tara:strand:+ start:13475 stop:14194 length:720 start_codon:yes stop_codon:yes gene_type:complete
MNYKKDFRPRLSGNKKVAYDNINKKERRILVIGDIHAPFVVEGYLDFCKETYAKYNCNQVIFIGDIIDNHYASFHTTDPDGMGGGDELDYAIEEVAKWNKEFPVADVLIGNHDRIIMRKAFDSQIPQRWIKSYNDVLGTNWNWQERIVYDDVQYVHGEGGTARTKSKNDMMSTVQGHIHTQAYCEWMVGRSFRIFGMQVGCGVDGRSYAAAYAKNFKKQAIGCGVVFGGHTAINCLMEL